MWNLSMRRFAAPAIACAGLQLGLATSAHAQEPHSISVIPRPVSMAARGGRFTLTARTTIWADRGDSAVARGLARELAPATGFDLSVHVGSSAQGNRVVFRTRRMVSKATDST